MKLLVPKNQLSVNPEAFLRRAGYALISDHRTGRHSFVRRLGRDYYPRLHLYVEEEGANYSFNLHLDQKQASYLAGHAHSGEYEGPLVEAEMKRLDSLLLFPSI